MPSSKASLQGRRVLRVTRVTGHRALVQTTNYPLRIIRYRREKSDLRSCVHAWPWQANVETSVLFRIPRRQAHPAPHARDLAVHTNRSLWSDVKRRHTPNHVRAAL